jgi:hypothetical protein
MRNRAQRVVSTEDGIMVKHEPTQRRSVIYLRYRRDPRTGRVLDAREYGHKAWPIRITLGRKAK